jgi:hypothetical protein
MSGVPMVTDGDAIDDKPWSMDNPMRRYRARPATGSRVCLGRWRSGGVFLRTLAMLAKVPASEDEIASLWFQAAYPDWSAEKARKWACKALKRGAL